jgi:hypothetical protein
MYSVISGQNISTTGMVILEGTASLLDIASVQQESTNDAVLNSITIPVVLKFCSLMTQYILVLTFLLY